MVWTRKSSAPLSFNLGEAFAASITGDAAWDWLLGWIPISGGMVVHTDEFCALGPPADRDVDAPSWLSWASGGVVGAIARALLISQLTAFMRARQFSAFCELVVPSGTWTDYHNAFECTPAGGNWGLFVIPIPAGATHGHAIFSGVTPPGAGDIWQYRMVLWTDAVGGGRVDIGSGLPGAGASGWDSGVFSVVGFTHFTIMLISATDVTTHVECGNVQLQFDAGGTTTHTAAPPVEPTGLLPPTTRTYTDIGDLGAELDAQEFKLDAILAQVMWLGEQLTPPTATVGESPVEVTDSAIDIGAATGIAVHVSGVPAGWGKEFSVPERYFPMGRITLTTPAGDLPAIDLTQITQVVEPLPAGVTQAVVFVKPPMTATYVLLAPPTAT